MLRTILRHPLLVGAAEVLVDATLYVAALLVVLALLTYVARLAAAAA